MAPRFHFQYDEALAKPQTPELYDGGFSFEEEQQMLRGWCFKKGGGGGSQTSTVYQSQLPEYARPYYENMMGQAEAVAGEDYQPYGGQRIADFSPDTEAAQQGIRSIYMQGNPSVDLANMYTNMATQNVMGSQYNPGTIFNTYQQMGGYAPAQYGGSNFNYMDIAGQLPTIQSGQYQMQQPADVSTQDFSSAIRDQYMSPYMSGVIDRAKQGAYEDFARQKTIRHGDYAQAGAYGGSRQAVGDFLAEDALNNNLMDIEARGLQSAFENAQSQFERDRNARLQANLANQGMAFQTGAENLRAGLQGGLANLNAVLGGLTSDQAAQLQAQQLGEQSRQFGANLGETSRQFGTELGEQSAQFAANQDYQTQMANEQLQQFAAQYGLDANQLAGQLSGQLGGLGELSQGLALDRTGALASVGSDIQQQEQRYLDQSYEDFLNQRDYDRQTLSWLSGILQGVPVQANSSVVQYQPSPNPYSQMLGLGLGGLSLYNAMGG